MAERRLERALAERGLLDPRAEYRARMRQLRATDARAFEAAASHYEDVVIGELIDASDPVAAWIEYGGYLGALLGPGETVRVSAAGRAEGWSPDAAAAELVLYIPNDPGLGIFVLSMPATPSPAQKAAHDLLVLGRQSLNV